MGAERSRGFHPKPSLSPRPANILGRRISFKEGALVIAVPWTGSLDDTIEIAKIAIVSRGVDFARIMDVDGSGAEVWSGRKNALEPA